VNRRTWVGRLFRRDREAARQLIIRTLRRNRGNVKCTAYELDFNRKYLFALFWRESLWHEVDAIRAQFPRCGPHAPAPDWLVETRKTLRKDNEDGLPQQQDRLDGASHSRASGEGDREGVEEGGHGDGDGARARVRKKKPAKVGRPPGKRRV
jgi:hypothetical protein